MNKRYYWLKLKNDFFKDKRIKKLRKIAGGDTYTIIYLKMQLLSLQDEGILYYDGVEDTFEEEIALQIDEDVEDVKITIGFLLRHGLLTQDDRNEYQLPETIDSIGSESDSAERVRRYRKNQKMLQCNGDVTKCNIEIDIDKDIDIDKKEINKEKRIYGEFKNVKLTDDEYKKLEEKNLLPYIERLSSYIASKGKKYKSHYATILNWSRKDIPKEENDVPSWFYKDLDKEEDKDEELDKILKEIGE